MTQHKYNTWHFTTEKDPEDTTHWLYTIHAETPCGMYHIESDEWYECEDDAKKFAIEKIERLMDGPDEPDYDTPNYFEQHNTPEYWEERFKLGE